jgi:hypothetical protein
MWNVLEINPVDYVIDKLASTLPDSMVSGLVNMDFFAGTPRALSFFASYTVPAATPYSLQYYEGATRRKLAYGTPNGVYEYDGITHRLISPPSGLSGALYWDTDAFGEWLVCTNDIAGEVPHCIDVTSSGKLAPLPGWISSTECMILRVHRNHLFAANMIESGISYPNRVRWSTSAIAGTLPQSWTPLASNDAGVIDLEIPGGSILDMAAVGDSLFIGGPGGIWIARYTGGAYVYSFSQRSKVNGPRSHRCMASLGDAVAILTRDDLVIMDEQSEQSIMIGRNASVIAQMVEAQLIYIESTRELYVLYATSAGGIQQALIWNRDTGSWGQRTFQQRYTASAKGMKVLPTPAKTWEGLTPWTWEQWTGPWQLPSFDSPVYMLANQAMIAVPGGAEYNWQMTRENMMGPEGDRIRVRSIEAEIDGPAGQVVTLRLGSAEYPGQATAWGTARDYVLGAGPVRHDDIVLGKYVSWQVGGTGKARISRLKLYYRVNPTRP